MVRGRIRDGEIPRALGMTCIGDWLSAISLQLSQLSDPLARRGGGEPFQGRRMQRLQKVQWLRGGHDGTLYVHVHRYGSGEQGSGPL